MSNTTKSNTTKNGQFMIVKTTYPNMRSAKKLGKSLLEKKLAACVQFVPIESSYLWKGVVKNDKEILVMIKSKFSAYEAIEKLIRKDSKYDVTQIIATEIGRGSESYLNWISSVVK